ncbi:uncharacterized protein LOC129907676 [Episyrphus balteatus]|uniref:uncharacterized protein LOC129907676 n=1 Tax=Episyrphus balteatus TaxID=286459 RepID=UPI002486091C|nr:uncharacterized protein LOC129907676 [Episyrphus balteatus]
MKTNLKNDNERLHLKFYVKASMEAHILLSENNSYKWKFPAFNFQIGYFQFSFGKNPGRGYEIVIGGLRNTISWISAGRDIGVRLKRARNTKVDSPNILSSSDPIPIEIIQTNDGELIVNIPGYSVPFLKYWDTDPVNINYFSFATYGGNSAEWFFNCPFDVISHIKPQKMIDPRPKEEQQLLLTLLAKINDLETKLKQVPQTTTPTPTTTTTVKPKIDIRIGK